MKKVILGSLAVFIGFQAHAEVSCRKLLVSQEAALLELIAQNFPDLKVKIETKSTGSQLSLAFEKYANTKLNFDVVNKAIEFRQNSYDNVPYSKRASSREYDAALDPRSGIIKIAKLGYTDSRPTVKGAVALTHDGREGIFHEPSRNNHDYRPKPLEFVIEGAQTISNAGNGKFIIGTKSGEIYLVDAVSARMNKATLDEAIALKDSKDLHKTASDGEYVAKLNERDGYIELARTGSEDRPDLKFPLYEAIGIRSAGTKGNFIVKMRTGEEYLLDANTRMMQKTERLSEINQKAIVDVDVIPQTKSIPIDAAIIKEYGGNPDRVNQFMIETDWTKSPIVRITQVDGTVIKVELWKLFK